MSNVTSTNGATNVVDVHKTAGSPMYGLSRAMSQALDLSSNIQKKNLNKKKLALKIFLLNFGMLFAECNIIYKDAQLHGLPV